MPLFTGLLRNLTTHLHTIGAMSDEEYRRRMRRYKIEEAVVSIVIAIALLAAVAHFTR